MYVKLTLNIDQEVIENAKIYAKNAKRSVSKLVEEYLSSISNTKDTSAKTLGPITKKLAGIIKTDKKSGYKELLTDALMEKLL
jgi:ethanolamine utilization protein EutA (predicted chaperonin)